MGKDLSEAKSPKEDEIKSSKRPIVKKDSTINIGSIDGENDVILTLLKGKPLPEKVDDKFFSSLESEQII